MARNDCRRLRWCRLCFRSERQNAQYQGDENADEYEEGDAGFVHRLPQPLNVGITRHRRWTATAFPCGQEITTCLRSIDRYVEIASEPSSCLSAIPEWGQLLKWGPSSGRAEVSWGCVRLPEVNAAVYPVLPRRSAYNSSILGKKRAPLKRDLR